MPAGDIHPEYKLCQLVPDNNTEFELERKPQQAGICAIQDLLLEVMSVRLPPVTSADGANLGVMFCPPASQGYKHYLLVVLHCLFLCVHSHCSSGSLGICRHVGL